MQRNGDGNMSDYYIRVCEEKDAPCGLGCGKGPCQRRKTTPKNDQLTTDINLILESDKFGQFDDDFDQPLAKPIRAALRRLCTVMSPEEKPAAAPFSLTEDDGQEGLAFRYAHELVAKRLGTFPAAAPSTLGEQVRNAQAKLAAMSPAKRASLKLEGADLYAPSPADERAALSDQDIYDKFSFLEGLVNESTYVQIADTAIEIARAASANETLVEGVDALAPEVWSAAQRAPGEGIEDAVQRVAAILARSPASANETSAVGTVHRPAPNGQDFSVEWVSSPPAGPLYAAPPTTFPRRMWINQPSASQPFHDRNGQRVLAVPDVDRDGVSKTHMRIYFIDGSTISCRCSRLELSDGWPESSRP